MIFTNLNLLSLLFLFFTFLFVVILFFYFYKRQIIFNKNFKLLASNSAFFIKFIFLSLSFIILGFSLLGPKIGEKNLKIEAKGVDILFVLDVSKSMNVADISNGKDNYTRLDIIKSSIFDFVKKHPNDRFGLTIFAGDATSIIPLTTDHSIFLTFLKGVDYRNLTKQGTDFKKAISLSVDRFSKDTKRSKVMVLISDGGDEDEELDLSYLKQIKETKDKINYFIVGVGTNKGGKIITGKDVFGNISYQIYNGNYVIGKLNSGALQSIANSLAGDYLKINRVADLSKINGKIENLKQEIIKKEGFGEKKDIGRILAFYSFLFFVIFLFLQLFEDKIFRKKQYD